MYAQWHAVPWTQECDQEESYTRRLTNALYVERYKYNEFIRMRRNRVVTCTAIRLRGPEFKPRSGQQRRQSGLV